MKNRRRFEAAIDGIFVLLATAAILGAVWYTARMARQALSAAAIEAEITVEAEQNYLRVAVFLPEPLLPETPEPIPRETTEPSFPSCGGEAPDLEEWREDAEYIAKTIWGEARGCSDTGKAAVAWCILNRVDAGSGAGFRDTIQGVVTQSEQFYGYNAGNPVTEELYEIALDVLERWAAEKNGTEDVGRVLPKECLWFTGRDGLRENVFRDAYRGGNYWDWSLSSPYEEE